MATISQREARRLRKKVAAMERLERDRNSAWSQEWPMGKHIGRVQLSADSFIVGAVKTARLLGHAVVCSVNDGGMVNFHAMPLSQ